MWLDFQTSNFFKTLSSLWGRYYERELSLKKNILFGLTHPPHCFKYSQQLHTNKSGATFL